MQDFGPHGKNDDRTNQRLVEIQQLVRDASAEIARIRASTASLEAVDATEWALAQRSAHNIAARARSLDLGILASCARELERFAGIIANVPHNQADALRSAGIAIETIDLELSVLSKSGRTT